MVKFMKFDEKQVPRKKFSCHKAHFLRNKTSLNPDISILNRKKSLKINCMQIFKFIFIYCRYSTITHIVYYHETFNRINFVKLFNFLIFFKYLMKTPEHCVPY